MFKVWCLIGTSKVPFVSTCHGQGLIHTDISFSVLDCCCCCCCCLFLFCFLFCCCCFLQKKKSSKYTGFLLRNRFQSIFLYPTGRYFYPGSRWTWKCFQGKASTRQCQFQSVLVCGSCGYPRCGNRQTLPVCLREVAVKEERRRKTPTYTLCKRIWGIVIHILVKVNNLSYCVSNNYNIWTAYAFVKY